MMKILKVPISDVRLWDKNPRNIKTEDYERLKKQITELGVYKPLIAVAENGGYTVLGGNMRLRALQEMGIKEVDISVVEATTEALKIKYALSDNEHMARFDEQALAELVFPHIDEIDLKDYNISRGQSVNIDRMLGDFVPGEAGEQARLDKLTEKERVTCPECGCEFIP